MNNTENNMALCPNCETGRKDYLLDKGSVYCTYILCLKDGVCSMYAPIEAEQRLPGALRASVI